MQPSRNAASQTSTAMRDNSDIPILATFLLGDSSEAMDPGNGDGEECGTKILRLSPAAQAFTDTLHELANAVTALLVNAQVLGWKLPPYSRLKRPLREIERHAQRSGALLKCLLHQFEATKEADLKLCRQVPFLHEPMLGNMAAVTEPDACVAGSANLPPLAPLRPAPGSGFSSESGLTSLCDRCTSAYFPKEE